MSDLLDLISDMEIADAHECVTHALLPDMSAACGTGVLDAALGCSERGHFFFGGDWSRVTCVWCHSLGRVWFREMCRRAQDRQAVVA